MRPSPYHTVSVACGGSPNGEREREVLREMPEKGHFIFKHRARLGVIVGQVCC